MAPTLAAITAIVVLVTATLSGIFGMAGGMILMAFLTFTYSVGAAMMLHGVTQAVSNGYRAVINRSDIVWRLVATNMAGSLAAPLPAPGALAAEGGWFSDAMLEALAKYEEARRLRGPQAPEAVRRGAVNIVN